MPVAVDAFEPAARIAVATLFNSLWEAALLAFVVGILLRAVPNLSATTRYAAWSAALIASLLLPLATALPQIRVERPAAPPHAQTHPSRQQTAARVLLPVPKRAVPAQASTTAPPSSFRVPGRLRFALPQYVALTMFAAWCIAALLLLARLAVNLWKLEHLKSDALPLPVEYRERLERWSAAEKGEREVRLCTCEDIEVPVAVGLFDSMILIPKHLLDTLSQEEIDQIILHELAHLRRGDDWTNGLQRLIQALLFFNPAVLYVAAQLDLEREVACDDWVVDQTKEVRPYATCLAKMAEVTAWPHRPLAAPGVFVTRRGLSVRVERLLRAGRNIRTSVAFGPTGAIVAALVVSFFVLQNVAPSFAFTLPQQQAAVAPATAVPHAVVARVTPRAKTTPAAKAAPASPQPKVRIINVPARHVHVPARDIRIPAINLDVPAQHIAVPAAWPVTQRVPGITVSRAVSQAMSQAFGGSGGRYTCVGCDYSGQNLSGKSFRGQQLSGPDFSRANLRSADFSYSVLVGADFSRADLRGANFAHAKLTGCDLSHAQLTGVNFQGVSMMGCQVDARSLAPSQAAALLHGCRMGCDFSYADLSGQDLRNLTLTGTDLSHANLRGADLSGARLEGVDFTGARLDGARFNGTEMTGCDFTGVDLHNVNFSNARITGSTLSGTVR